MEIVWDIKAHVPDAEVIIGDKWRRLVLGGVGEDERGDVGQHDGGTRHHEESSSPSATKNYVVTSIELKTVCTSNSPLPVSVRVTCRHLPGLGHVGGLHQTKQGAPQQRHGDA